MVDENLKLLENGVTRVCEITVTLDFIFWLVLYSHEDVSFNIIFRNVFEGIKQLSLSMWFKKNRLETPFKGDNVKALIKTSNCERLYLSVFQKIAAFAMLFWISVTKTRFKMFLASSNDQKYPRYPLALKSNVGLTLARPLRLVIPYFF